LARFDGSEASLPVLIAFRGLVYDVSASFMWMQGRHFWRRAGRDLTAQIERAPHREEVFQRVRCVGILAIRSQNLSVDSG
jgi:predicted heme/steroid binding protein